MSGSFKKPDLCYYAGSGSVYFAGRDVNGTAYNSVIYKNDALNGSPAWSLIYSASLDFIGTELPIPQFLKVSTNGDLYLLGCDGNKETDGVTVLHFNLAIFSRDGGRTFSKCSMYTPDSVTPYDGNRMWSDVTITTSGSTDRACLIGSSFDSVANEYSIATVEDGRFITRIDSYFLSDK